MFGASPGAGRPAASQSPLLAWSSIPTRRKFVLLPALPIRSQEHRVGAEPGPWEAHHNLAPVSSLQWGPLMGEDAGSGRGCGWPWSCFLAELPLTLPLTNGLNRSSSAQQSTHSQRKEAERCFWTLLPSQPGHVVATRLPVSFKSADPAHGSLNGLSVSRSDWEGEVGWL